MSSASSPNAEPQGDTLQSQVTAALGSGPDIRLELGCGSSKRDAGAIGIDVLPRPGVDIVGDAQAALELIPDASVTSVYSEHFLEHIDDPWALIAQCARVLRPGGTFVAVVPHFSNPWFYSDPTHSSYFGLYTFCYWVERSPFKRRVPQYTEPLPLSLDSVRHVFKSSPPFVFRHVIKKFLSLWVNSSTRTQEFYEEHVTWLMPCYEVHYSLTRLP